MIYQISVFLENRAGQLAEITKLLADNEVNLRAISIAETSDYGVLRMLTDDADKASSILLENGCVIAKTPVSVVAVPDKPSGLANLLAVISAAEIDVEYMYALFTKKVDSAYMVFRISDEEKFAKLLESHGMQAVSKDELGLK